MGVDACILVKITDPKSWLQYDQLRKLSAQMTATIGPEHFFLDAERNRHALEFLLDYNERYGICRKDGRLAYAQDGRNIIAKPNEQFITVNLMSRYYGKSYARGDWPTIHHTILWLQKNISDCEVWYGGDSSGIVARKMTAKRLKEFTEYFCSSGHSTYNRYWAKSGVCQFCQVPVTNCGGGGSETFFNCNSCGSEWVVTRMNSETPEYTKWDVRAEGRASMACFTMSEQIRQGIRKMKPFGGSFE